MGMSGHQSARMKSDTWLTPPEILLALGVFDLDPCCPPAMPWPTAARMISPPQDGLSSPWNGRVWLNPPFGNRAAAWLAKLAAHGNGIALIPARTETRMFYASVWPKADAVLFMRGRPHFHRADGTRANANSGAPIALVAYGEDNARILAGCGLGVCVHWSNTEDQQPRTQEAAHMSDENERSVASAGSVACPYVTGTVTRYCTLTPFTLTAEEQEAIQAAAVIMDARNRLGLPVMFRGSERAATLRGLLERTK